MPPGRRRRGRPNMTWIIYGVLTSVIENGLEDRDWNIRDMWRKMTVE